MGRSDYNCPLTNPFTLEDLNLVTAIFPIHDIGIFLLQSGFDNGLELFHKVVPPFTKRARVVGADVGNRIDGELRVGADAHRVYDETERWDEAPRENYPLSS